MACMANMNHQHIDFNLKNATILVEPFLAVMCKRLLLASGYQLPVDAFHVLEIHKMTRKKVFEMHSNWKHGKKLVSFLRARLEIRYVLALTIFNNDLVSRYKLHLCNLLILLEKKSKVFYNIYSFGETW